MTKIELEIHDNVITTLSKIRDINDSGIDIVIPQGSVLFENILNLKLIEKYAEEREISIQMSTESDVGNNLLSMLNGKGGAETFTTSLPTEEENLAAQIDALETGVVMPSTKKGFRIPKMSLPKFNIRKSRTFVVLLPLLIVLGYVFAGLRLPKANIKISVHSQPLTRSITIKVKANTETDSEQKILKGQTLSVSMDGFKEIDTTGEKLVGEKAQGEITVYNKTDTEIELDEGDELSYKGKSTDLVYYLKDSVIVPARAPEDSLDPASALIPGEATVEIIASDIGESYNIDGDSNLEFEKYKKSEMEGKSKEDIDGGMSEIVKIVSEEDKTTLSDQLISETTSSAEADIKKQASSKQSVIDGSTQSSVTNESFSYELDNETDKLSLTQSVYAEGLVYSKEELDNLLDGMVEDLIPEGFILSEKDREVNIEVLGNSTSSILSSTEADLQVTLKAQVVPDIKEESLKEQLRGKGSKEVEKILGSVKNVKSYEFKLSPSIPFFQKVPKNVGKINISIEIN
ncbi:hypothetical protein KKG08_00135 [Patescibacteria group bacterium]|nr:hypothetical protein [Patescibacteria group bacterium]